MATIFPVNDLLDPGPRATEDPLTHLLAGKVIWRIFRPLGGKLRLDFTDGTFLLIDPQRGELEIGTRPEPSATAPLAARCASLNTR